MKIAVVTISPEVLRGLLGAAARLDEEYPGWGELTWHYASPAPSDEAIDAMCTDVATADLVMCDMMGADSQWPAALGTTLDTFTGDIISCGPAFASRARFGAFDIAGARKPAMGMPKGMPPHIAAQLGRKEGTAQPPTGMPTHIAARLGMTPGASASTAEQAAPEASDLAARDARIYAQVTSAFLSMRGDDADFVLRTLVRERGGLPDLEVPDPSGEIAPVQCSWPPTRKRYATWQDFVAEHGPSDGRPVIALLHYARSYPIDGETVAAKLVEHLSQAGWVLPVAIDATGTEMVDPLRELLTSEGLKPDVIVSLLSFRFAAGPMGGDPEAGAALLSELGAPYVKPIMLTRRTEQEWRESFQGLGPAETMVSLVLPEIDGAVNEILVAAMTPTPIDDSPGAPVVDNLQVIDDQAHRLVQRIQGLIRLRQLANHEKRVAIIGYDYPDGEGNMLGAAFLDCAASIEAILADLAQEGYQLTVPEPGTLLSELLDRAVNSPRYSNSDRTIVYPREQAIAELANPKAWAEVESVWGNNPDLPMVTPTGDFLIPAIELGNVLVGIQPGRAPLSNGGDSTHDNTIPPPPQYLAFYTWVRKVWKADVIVHVGTHGTFEFLKAKQNAVSTDCFPDLMIEETPHVYLYYCANPTEGIIARRRSHATLVSYQPPVMLPGGLHDQLADLEKLLAEHRQAVELSPQTAQDLLADIARAAEEAHLPTDPGELEAELERLSSGLVPMGLHVFGEEWNTDEVIRMVDGVLSGGLDDQMPAVEVMAGLKGLPDGAVEELPAPERAELEAMALEPVHRGLSCDLSPEQITDVLGLQDLVRRGREVAAFFDHNEEWEGLHRGLCGLHVPARLGGDVIRTPSVMPSGSSIYQFDPRAVPSSIAMRRGAEIARGLKDAYRAENGTNPSCVGLILWGIETSRTQGEGYAQVLALLGVRLVDHPTPGHPRWEVIPTEELTGPRTDVVVTISGFFRDLFGNLIEELDDIFAAVAAMDEPEQINPIRARAAVLEEALAARGIPEDQASQLATSRIFGPAPGLYATDLTAIIESGAWNSTDDLTDHFVDGAQHLYGRNHHGDRIEGLYQEQLADVEVVSQVRSNNEYQITDLDHYFEFLGGMTSAAERFSGRTVPTLVCDTTARRVHVQTSAEASRAGLYTRLLNPEWIEAIMAHGHRGVAEINERTTNLVGMAATTSGIGDWMFDAVFDTYIADEQMRQRLTEANPHATADLAARLGEADRRGLWQASPERRQLLDEVQFDIDADLEGVDD